MMRTPWKAALAAGSVLATVATLGAVSGAGATTTPDSTPDTTTTGDAAATTAAGSAAPSGDVGTIVIASADFPENELLAQIYGQALAAEGFDVEYQLGIGTRETILPALEGGEIHLVPEYTGSLLSFLLKPEQPTAANVDEQIAAIDEALPDGLEVLTPSVAEDKDTIVCTQEIVDEFGLTNLTDLAANSAEITLGAPPEFEDRTPFGVAGFSELLGAEFAEFVPLAFGDIPAALSDGAIDCGNMFSTSSSIVEGGFVALDDDQGLVPNEAVLPLVRSDVATPEVVAVLDDVSSRLDTETLTGLVAQVEIDAQGPDVVATDWLASDPPVVATDDPAGTTVADDTATTVAGDTATTVARDTATTAPGTTTA